MIHTAENCARQILETSTHCKQMVKESDLSTNRLRQLVSESMNVHCTDLFLNLRTQIMPQQARIQSLEVKSTNHEKKSNNSKPSDHREESLHGMEVSLSDNDERIRGTCLKEF